jgi:serine/threonine-protein kinase HipA
MTLLGHTDGQDYADGVSYLDIVHFIQSHGSNVRNDLEQLWRRIVFSICVSNIDDHLRNHGFLLTDRSWVLSPAFDINPVETGAGLKLNISENDNALDLQLAMDVHEYFRLDYQKAKDIMIQVQTAVCRWRKKADALKISKTDQEIKQLAFNKAERKLF